jgi:NDP-sugar pyrophosphorylase family protein
MEMTAPQKTRHAIILAAGQGSRLQPYTNDRPKPLVAVNGVPILINALNNLIAAGVEEVTIVVGYRHGDIRSLVGDQFDTMAVRYVYSSDFATTGSAWSLWLAAEALAAHDVFLLEGDVVFEPALLSRIADHPARNVTAVASFQPFMQGSAALIGPDNTITSVRTGLTGADLRPDGPALYKTVNISRLSREMSEGVLLPFLGACAETGERDLFVEQVLQRLTERDALDLVAARCDDLKWFEVDSPEDLAEAAAIFNDRSR